nr:ferrochelatase-2, chloroplastic-like [Tanacetum cinerariifolium]
MFKVLVEASKPSPHASRHARQVTCRSSWNCNTTGSAITNLQLRTLIESRSLAGKTLCYAGVWTHPISGTESYAHVEEEKVRVLLFNLEARRHVMMFSPFCTIYLLIQISFVFQGCFGSNNDP